MCEVYVGFQRPAQALVECELFAIVDREGLAFVLRDVSERGFGPEHEIRGHLPGQGVCDKELGLPLREGGDVSLLPGSLDRIALPIADTFLPVDYGAGDHR